ncbi:MAG: enoyl-CoA hydratase [Alphaproteobacteria bacterium]|nr:enoyl-CoA hydratase [Alphaproteobacteria bacterium]
MGYETLGLEKDDGIATITMSRPASLNALDVKLAAELREVLEDLREDSDVRVLIITGSGRGFCAGGDVAAFHANLDHEPRYLRDLLLHFHTAMACLVALPFPVIASINGVAAGAGMGFCLAPDLAIAAESAVFTMAYTRIGATPDGSTTYFLPRVVGTRRAMEMILLNRSLTAAEALDWGIVNMVVADGALEDEVKKLAIKLRDGPTVAYSAARRLVGGSFDASLAAQLEREGASIAAMGATADFREGVTAFVEKRPAQFKGR